MKINNINSNLVQRFLTTKNSKNQTHILKQESSNFSFSKDYANAIKALSFTSQIETNQKEKQEIKSILDTAYMKLFEGKNIQTRQEEIQKKAFEYKRKASQIVVKSETILDEANYFVNEAMEMVAKNNKRLIKRNKFKYFSDGEKKLVEYKTDKKGNSFLNLTRYLRDGSHCKYTFENGLLNFYEEGYSEDISDMNMAFCNGKILNCAFLVTYNSDCTKAKEVFSFNDRNLYSYRNDVQYDLLSKQEEAKEEYEFDSAIQLTTYTNNRVVEEKEDNEGKIHRFTKGKEQFIFKNGAFVYYCKNQHPQDFESPTVYYIFNDDSISEYGEIIKYKNFPQISKKVFKYDGNKFLLYEKLNRIKNKNQDILVNRITRNDCLKVV